MGRGKRYRWREGKDTGSKRERDGEKVCVCVLGKGGRGGRGQSRICGGKRSKTKRKEE